MAIHFNLNKIINLTSETIIYHFQNSYMKYLPSIILVLIFTFSACKSSKIQENSTATVETQTTKPVSKPKSTPIVKPKPPKDERFKTDIGADIPDFSFAAIDGKTYNISDFKGKVVWLNFFATWCGPCLVEIPELNELSEENKDVVFISIGREHTVEELIPFAEKKEMTYIVGADPERNIFRLFGEKYIPRNYLIDKEGKIVEQRVGYNETTLKKLVAAMETSKGAEK